MSQANTAAAHQSDSDDGDKNNQIESIYHRCRFYRNKMPQVGDITKVVTTQLMELGANVQLLEYGNIEGFIQMTHATNKRIRSIHKLLKIGKREFMEVLRVDEAKQYVDLGKKSLKPEEVDEAAQNYKKCKKVHEIMIECAVKLKTPIETLYEQWGWDLYDECGQEHAYDALRVACQNPELILPKLNISEEHKSALMETLSRKMPQNPIKIRADCKLTCTTSDGIDVIKEALLTAKHALNDDKWKLEFKMHASPIYRVEVTTLSRGQGEDQVRKALNIIKKVMKKNGGKFRGEEPKVVGAYQEEQEVAELIENAAGVDDSGEEDNQEGIELAVDEPEELDDSDEDEEKKDE